MLEANLFSATNSAPEAEGFNSFIVFPMSLDPDVANKTIFLPFKSYCSKKVFIIVGATYHQIGKPTDR